MENNDLLFGAKEFYGVTFRALYDFVIGNRKIQEGEVIVRFEDIQIATLDEKQRSWRAHGGYDDRSLVVWDETQSVNFSFTQGTFSKLQMAALTNSKIARQIAPDTYNIPKTEFLESNENGQFSLQWPARESSIQVHNVKTGDRINIESFDALARTVTINDHYADIVVDYYIDYDKDVLSYQIGESLIRGYITVEGKTRLKDDKTGNTVTGILTIPKLKLKSGLSVRLGREGIPMVHTFVGEGLPVGSRGNKVIAQLITLQDDIDSDF